MVARLKDWCDLEGLQPWDTLIVGNGLSINIWADFRYPGLFERAHFHPPAQRLFSAIGTQNFETVLEALWHAQMTQSALRRRADAITRVYEEVQSALFDAVRHVHVPYRSVGRTRLQQIFDAMRSHRYVFTLNYDLLTYWAAMQRGANSAIRDFFWSHDNTFDVNNTALGNATSAMLYLHGGLHLWQDSTSGRTGKWTTKRGTGVTLLSRLEASVSSLPNRRPLFVREGTSEQKMAVIRRSDYLTYALRTLVDNASDTVIFGASFAEQDKHITHAITAGPKRDIAISIRRGDRDQMNSAIANYRANIPNHRLHFFDSASHPLGDPSLTVG